MAENTDGESLRYDPDFNGPLKRRSCTDVLCLGLFLVFIAVWIGIGLYAILNGDPSMLLVPKDSYGQRCGKDAIVKDQPYLLFFDLTKCLDPTVPFTGCQTPQVCVSKCPTEFFSQTLNGTNAPKEYCQSATGTCPSWLLPSQPFLNLCLYNVADRKKLSNLDVSHIRGDEISTIKGLLNPIRLWMNLVIQNGLAIFTKSDDVQQHKNLNYAVRPMQTQCRLFIKFIAFSSYTDFNAQKHIAGPVQYVVKNRCIPILASINENMLEQIQQDFSLDKLKTAISNVKLVAQAEEVGLNVVEDLINSWWKIIIGILFAVLVCIIYILILRWTAAPIVWFSIVGVIVALGAGIYFTSIKYIQAKKDYDSLVIQDDDSTRSHLKTSRDLWLAGLIVLSVVTVIILLMLIFLRKRIVLAIALIKEGSKAVSSVTASLFFPIFPWILQLGVIAYAIAVAIYLSSSGKPLYATRNVTATCTSSSMIENNAVCEPANFSSLIEAHKDVCKEANCKFIRLNSDTLYPYLQVYNVFGFFWLAFFVSALGQMVLAGVFAQWYWTFKKRNLPFFSVTSALSRTLRYHIGTLAFGSLIIAICRMIRVVLEYIDHKLKKYDNELTKAIMCLLKCFFYCLEKFLKFINKNAYIMCAVHGRNFCASAKDAFMLLMRNIIRVFVLDKVTDFLFFLSKVLLTLGVGAVSYVVFATDLVSFVDNSQLHYGLVPVLIIMISTYLIASLFFSVYSMAVDTLFLCFLEDCERNDGTPEKPYYMSKNLMKIFGKHNKKLN